MSTYPKSTTITCSFTGVTVSTRAGAVLRTVLFLSFVVFLVVFSPVHAAGVSGHPGRSVSTEHKTEHGVPGEKEKLRKRAGVLLRETQRRSVRVPEGRTGRKRVTAEDVDSAVRAGDPRAVGSAGGLCEAAHSQSRLQVYRR
ncbi:hypothetical protein CEP50_01120 [Actinopolyspora mortivallis]|uniref:Transmembrane protein n=1 Tax=Actinopolyspora mortivallis TaxID=33906 RepID=A0A2T0H1A1_ACTMO|nr:hypothetical protein CEP50_01120 [Actinopolyspora mortivallis]